MTDEPSLWEKMRNYATTHDNLVEDWLELADKLEEAAKGFYAEPPTLSVKQFLGHYARARRAWCNETGEPLV